MQNWITQKPFNMAVYNGITSMCLFENDLAVIIDASYLTYTYFGMTVTLQILTEYELYVC